MKTLPLGGLAREALRHEPLETIWDIHRIRLEAQHKYRARHDRQWLELFLEAVCDLADLEELRERAEQPDAMIARALADSLPSEIKKARFRVEAIASVCFEKGRCAW